MKPPYKVIAMHDMCGYGRSSLTAALPVLAALNCQVCPLPTALLSSHFGFKTLPTFLNLGEEIKKFIPQWKEEKLTFDCFYSGYLAGPEQVSIALEYIDTFNPKWIYIDPVLGDDEKLYPGFNDSQVEAMRELVKRADVISPNLTEALFLLGEEPKIRVDEKQAKEITKKLSLMGVNYVIVTGVPSDDGSEITVYAYSKKENKYYSITTKRFDKWFHGTGDSFASAILGNLLDGVSFEKSLNRAMSYLYKTAELAMEFGTELCLETALPFLMRGEEFAQIKEI